MFHSSALTNNKKLMKTKKVMMMAVLSLFSVITKPAPNVKTDGHKVSATKYHPVKSQCSGNPLVTADGSKINLSKLKAGKLRWVAVSRDLLRRHEYGDTILVISENKHISGKWVIHDTMNSRFRQKIDFLMHPGSSHVIPRKVTIIPV